MGHDGPTTLQMAREFSPKVTVTDIGLPIMGGHELGELIRGQFGDTLRWVALTGYGRASGQRRSIEPGFDAHLVKKNAMAQLHELPDGLPDSDVGTP